MHRTDLPSLLVSIACAAFAAAPAAQDAAELERRYQHKLEARFLERVEWVTDLELAKQRAQAEDRLIFAYFTRSYAP